MKQGDEIIDAWIGSNIFPEIPASMISENLIKLVKDESN